MTRRTLPLLLAVALLASACGSGGDGAASADRTTAGGEELVAHVASYDLAVGTQRFMVGLVTVDNEFVSGGTARLRFSFLEGAEPEPAGEATATFLAVPGEEAEHEHAEAGPQAEGRGVYAAEDVAFDRAGTWQVEVTADVDGRELTGTAAFAVAQEHAVPTVGDPALSTRNHTLDDVGEVPPGAVDSRADEGGEIPDRRLHRTSIAEALEAGHPIVAVFATPVYCASRFCGPITDMIAELERDYGDRAVFVHVEIWRNFQERVINEAAADWLYHGGDMNEPWVFFIDGDGVIRARWDNVATREEIEPFLEDLPPLR